MCVRYIVGTYVFILFLFRWNIAVSRSLSQHITVNTAFCNYKLNIYFGQKKRRKYYFRWSRVFVVCSAQNTRAFIKFSAPFHRRRRWRVYKTHSGKTTLHDVFASTRPLSPFRIFVSRTSVRNDWHDAGQNAGPRRSSPPARGHLTVSVEGDPTSPSPSGDDDSRAHWRAISRVAKHRVI